MCEDVISAGNLAFIGRIWADCSPGYDASEDLAKVKERIREPAHFQAALGHYRGQVDPSRSGSPQWAAEQAAAWGRDTTQPTPAPARHPGRLPRHDPGAGQPGTAALRPPIAVRADRGASGTS